MDAVFASITEVTREASIDEIIAALSAIQSNPIGTDNEAPALAARLRDALGLSPAANPCPETLAGVGEALRLARIAAADGATASLGQPFTTVSAIPASTPPGVGGFGYD